MIRHALAPVLPAAAQSLEVPRTLDPASGGVALTFDDGPHPQGTPAVLDALARAGARATFFVVGEQAAHRPRLVGEIAAAGHAVALHGYRHRLQLRLSAGQVRADIERGLDVLSAAADVEVRWHRPPYGVYSAAGLRAVRASGLRPLLWSRWGKDWRRYTTPARIAARATRGLCSGDVILLHDADFYNARDSHLRTVRALEAILSHLSHLGIDTVLPV